MAAEKPVEIRRNPDNPKQAAYKTGPGVTAGDWFVFDADNGGYYASADEVADWK